MPSVTFRGVLRVRGRGRPDEFDLRRIRAHTAYAIRTTPTGRLGELPALSSSPPLYRYALKKLSIFSTAGSTYSGLS